MGVLGRFQILNFLNIFQNRRNSEKIFKKCTEFQKFWQDSQNNVQKMVKKRKKKNYEKKKKIPEKQNVKSERHVQKYETHRLTLEYEFTVFKCA